MEKKVFVLSDVGTGKGFVRGLVVGIAVFICIAGCAIGHAHAISASTTPDSLTILHSFDGEALPQGDLTLSGSTLFGMTFGGGVNGYGTIFQVNPDGTGFQVLHSFGSSSFDAVEPQGDLTLSGSTLYGMGLGAIFQINTDGTGYQVLYNFGSVANDGANPSGSLTLSGSGSALYGMTKSGGAHSSGTIFQINTDGTGYKVLYSFGGIANDGRFPYGSLTLSVSGTTLYGMTSAGGAYGSQVGGYGTIFQINTDGTGYQVLYSFGSVARDGANPSGSLTLSGSGSVLYGMTPQGGSNGLGAIFRINTDGTGYQVLHSLDSATNDGFSPSGSLTLSGSTLYGMNSQGGSSGGYGTIFQINTDGSGYQVLYDFGSIANDGRFPNGSLTLLGSVLYGMTEDGGSGGGTIFALCITPTVPGEPTGVTAAAGIGQAAVSFTASTLFSCSPVSSFTVTSDPDGITATGAESPIIVPGLTNGVAYTFTVTATNDIGTGQPSSSSNSVTPFAVPPSSIAALAGTWEANAFATGPDLPWWERTTLTVMPDGTFTSSGTENNGAVDNGSGAFWIFPNGIVPTMTGGGHSNNTLCQIDPGNTVLACTETWPDSSTNLITYTKQAALYSLADLAGNWGGNYLISGQTPAWIQDSITVNPDGTYTDTYTESGSNWSTYTGAGTMSISSSGVISRSCVSGYCLNGTNYSGFMDAGKTVMLATSGASTSSEGAVLYVYAKQASSYSLADLVGAWQSNSLASGPGAPWWERATMTVNPNGTFTTSGTENSGYADNGSGNCWICPPGVITCEFDDYPSHILSGVMNADKTVMAMTYSWSGANGTLTPEIAVFTKSAGSLTVTIGPSAAVNAGAMWIVDGGNWQTSGTTVSGITVGSHTVAFNNIAGWTTPPSQTAIVTDGQTTSLGGSYVQLPSGSLSVTIGPYAAVSDGAMWNVDGGATWYASGAVVPNLNAGPHTVAFSGVQGWATPSSRTVNITNGQTASATGTYTPVFAAIFNASITSGKAPLKVHFTNCSAGSFTKWLWHFGDGQTSKIWNPNHTYSKAGTYTVTLTMTGASGTCTCTQPGFITVYAAPKANFSASPRSGDAPLQVNFTNESSGLVTSRQWNFGDGTTSTDENPTHTYDSPRTYKAKLTVYGPGGAGSKTVSIIVKK
jgi:uncharacterized repeat protein (TIGR03803 family)